MALATIRALTMASEAKLLEAALSWIAADPDSATRNALQGMVDAGDMEGLDLVMGEALAFGTAGIRGEVGPGSARMNRAMVIKTTAGLARYLHDQGRDKAPVVVGFDARPSSRQFAEDAVGVLAAAGIPVRYFPEVAPTPVVAFAARQMNAGAAVVVTASHNPPADNGYKVYSANAAQIIPPEDADIAAAISGVGPANAVVRVEDAFATTHELIDQIDESLYGDYYHAVDETRPSPQTSNLTFVYTPMHGVGGRVLAEMFTRARHTGLTPVLSQFEPDGAFPTVSFPNPEEEGALDLALELASETQADAVLANDPDADRLATAVPHEGGWRLLSGNELGALLGDYVLRRWNHDETPIVANSIVSSPILQRLAARHGAHHEVTLTGFKWIANAGLALESGGVGRFAFGFEEALGYTIGRTVRDKDGLSAALVFSDLVTEEQRSGRSVLDRLVDIWKGTGLWVSAQHSIVRPGPSGQSAIADAVRGLGDRPPSEVGEYQVTGVVDYRIGADDRPIWLGAQQLIELQLGESGRVLVRPSGTEPKLKVYVDLSGEVGSHPHRAHADLSAAARALAVWVGGSLGL